MTLRTFIMMRLSAPVGPIFIRLVGGALFLAGALISGVIIFSIVTGLNS